MLKQLILERKQGDVCSHEHAFFLDNWVRRLFQSPGKIVGEYIQLGNTVIDLGCGPGYFAIDMARMVGDEGRVIAVDLQPEMLEKTRQKAQKYGLNNMSFHCCQSATLDLSEQADFILAYYMIHETPNAKNCLTELRTLLKPGGKLLVVEPKFHVSQRAFADMLDIVEDVGLQMIEQPQKKGGRAVLLTV